MTQDSPPCMGVWVWERDYHLSCLCSPTDGPSLTVGPTQYYVLLGNNISLVCGTDLDSNPPATVTWTSPDDSRIIMDNARYDVENGPDIVRLNISHTSLADAGMWTCDIRVLSENYIVNNGSLVLQDPSLIGTPVMNVIHLTVICKLVILSLDVEL